MRYRQCPHENICEAIIRYNHCSYLRSYGVSRSGFIWLWCIDFWFCGEIKIVPASCSFHLGIGKCQSCWVLVVQSPNGLTIGTHHLDMRHRTGIEIERGSHSFLCVLPPWLKSMSCINLSLDVSYPHNCFFLFQDQYNAIRIISFGRLSRNISQVCSMFMPP